MDKMILNMSENIRNPPSLQVLGAIPKILHFSVCCTTSRSLVKIYVVYEGIQHF